MAHLLERAHNDWFRELMDGFPPQWRAYRDELNRTPLAHESWGIEESRRQAVPWNYGHPE